MMADELGEIEKDLFARMIRAMSLTAVIVPALQAMSKPCRMDQFVQPGRREACAAMTARMTESDTALMQGLGIGIQEKWWAEGSSEREELGAQRRQLEYVGRASSPIRILHMKEDWQERLEVLRNSSRESDANRLMLAFYHLPLGRPANWKDPNSS